jgi:hypothetical protein
MPPASPGLTPRRCGSALFGVKAVKAGCGPLWLLERLVRCEKAPESDDALGLASNLAAPTDNGDTDCWLGRPTPRD